MTPDPKVERANYGFGEIDLSQVVQATFGTTEIRFLDAKGNPIPAQKHVSKPEPELPRLRDNN